VTIVFNSYVILTELEEIYVWSDLEYKSNYVK
jgi:hypothetical protein